MGCSECIRMSVSGDNVWKGNKLVGREQNLFFASQTVQFPGILLSYWLITFSNLQYVLAQDIESGLQFQALLRLKCRWLRRESEGILQLLLAAVTNGHELSGLKDTNSSFYSPAGEKSKITVWAEPHSSWMLQGRICFLPFSGLQGQPVFLGSWPGHSNFISVPLTSALLLPSYKVLCDDTGPIQIIQGNFLFAKSLCVMY